MRRLLLVPGYRVLSTPLSRASIWVTGVYAIVQGLIILLADPGRWGGPSFTILRQVPGAPYSWGLSALIFGLFILTGSLLQIWVVKAAGLLCLSSWALLFAAGSTAAVFAVPNAATTGGPTYVLIAVWTAILVWVDETNRGRTRAEVHRPVG